MKKAIFITLLLAIFFGLIAGTSGGFGIWYYLFKTGKIPVVSEEGKVIIKKEEKVTVEENSAIISAVEKVSPAVVSIVTKRDILSFWGEVFQQKGKGSGFILTSDGLILTNKHVVKGINELTIITSDGKNYLGKIVALDPLGDIALVKINAKNLPVVELGDSDKLKIGQRVIAIGNALGKYANTVTSGIVSARARAITATDFLGQASRFEGLIQTDAAINPGNSGGPLVNLEGQVVGINTAIETQGQEIGFAIPINFAKQAIKSYLEKGKIIRPFLGVRYILITKDFASLNNLPVDKGALLVRGSSYKEPAVIPNSPARKAGLREGDIIIAINDEKIDENKGLSSLISQYEPGDEIEILYLRNGKEKRVKVRLGEME